MQKILSAFYLSFCT